MSAGFYVWLGGAMMIFLAASAGLRRYVDTPSYPLIVLALLLYCIGNLMMVRLMREGGMGVAISVSAILQLLMANLVAVFIFGERPATIQVMGILLGVVAVGLILMPWRGQG